MHTRVTELRHVPANQLHANPRNWRTHPPEQRRALQSVLDEIGFAGAVLARERHDGELELVDGHLRVETAKDDDMLPVLILDVNEEEANKLLAVHDPIGGMATRDEVQLAALLDQIETDNADVQSLLDAIANDNVHANSTSDNFHSKDNRSQDASARTARQQHNNSQDSDSQDSNQPPQLRIVNVPESFQLLIDCRDEADQEQLDARLTLEGYVCRVLTV